ncbi:hypothetical protein PSYPI_42905, partial [Pseudomonas syringae pv. pisi str. 1704B]
ANVAARRCECVPDLSVMRGIPVYTNFLTVFIEYVYAEFRGQALLLGVLSTPGLVVALWRTRKAKTPVVADVCPGRQCIFTD